MIHVILPQSNKRLARICKRFLTDCLMTELGKHVWNVYAYNQAQTIPNVDIVGTNAIFPRYRGFHGVLTKHHRQMTILYGNFSRSMVSTFVILPIMHASGILLNFRIKA